VTIKGVEFKQVPNVGCLKGTSHGFTVRGGTEKVVADAALDAKNQTVSWILKHFGTQ
jgi:hypothetical protein